MLGNIIIARIGFHEGNSGIPDEAESVVVSQYLQNHSIEPAESARTLHRWHWLMKGWVDPRVLGVRRVPKGKKKTNYHPRVN